MKIFIIVFQKLKTGVRLEQYSSASDKIGGAWLGKNRTSGYRYYLGMVQTEQTVMNDIYIGLSLAKMPGCCPGSFEISLCVR